MREDPQPLGTLLLALAGGPHNECIWAAPYIKVAALERLLHACPADTKLVVVTRWRLDEIATGVSDIEIWWSHVFPLRAISVIIG